MIDLIKQPNGKYCSIDWTGTLIFENYTEQEIIDAYIKQAKEDINNAKHFTEIIVDAEYADSRGERSISDAQLKAMGFDKPYNELVKFIPREPLNQTYASCDFATYGKCPNCGGSVQDGMVHTDKKCRSCGQLLKW